jgi:UDP-glucuronate decarboxylase
MAVDGRPRRILIAGAAGFIGSHLCDALLARGMSVIGLDNYCTGRPRNLSHLASNPAFTFLQHDVIDPLPLSLRADLIFNLACAASPPHYQADPVHTLLTNVMGTRNLLALAADCGAGFVLASTSEVYGDPHIHPQVEDYWGNVNPTGPRACYDEGKRAAETLASDYARVGRVDARIARIFNTYGPRMRHDDGRVVSNMITQALRNEDITVYGDGTQTRSFCYIDDLVDGLLRLANHQKPISRPVNLGNPVELTVADLAEKVLALTEASSRVVRRPLPVDDPKRRKPNISVAEKLLDWSPKVPLAKGLVRTIEWLSRDPAVIGTTVEVKRDIRVRSRPTVRAPAV